MALRGHEKKSEAVGFRLSEDLRARVDALAKTWGISFSNAARQLLVKGLEAEEREERAAREAAEKAKSTPLP